jgi:hypothetical protein
MKILQNEITGNKLVFRRNFGGELSFILSFLFLSASAAGTTVFFFLANWGRISPSSGEVQKPSQLEFF